MARNAEVVYAVYSHGNPTHYRCITVLRNIGAEVFIEYDYSNMNKIDAHIYHMVFDNGAVIDEPRKWTRSEHLYRLQRNGMQIQPLWRLLHVAKNPRRQHV